MAPQKLQKTFYLSSTNVKTTIENRINDIAIRSNQSTSYVIERALIDSLFPANIDARYIICANLYADNGVQRTLSALFSFNAGGVEPYRSKYNNLKPVIEYMLKWVDPEQMYNHSGSGYQVHYHLVSQLESIVGILEESASCCIESMDRELDEAQAKWAKELLNKARRESPVINVREHLDLALTSHMKLNGFRLYDCYLMDLARIANYPNNEYMRDELTQIINEISKEWR